MARLPPELDFASVYVTSDLLDEPKREDRDLTALLAELSAYDVIAMIGRLSAALHMRGRAHEPQGQLELLRWLAAGVPGRLDKYAPPVRRGAAAIFAQQLLHAARLGVRHAADRDPDEFHAEADRARFADFLFGVSDVFEPTLDLHDQRRALSWALKHWPVALRTDRLTLWSTYFEVFRRIWPKLQQEGLPDAASAFARYTGLSIERYMSLGMVFSFAFAAIQPGEAAPGRAWLDPADYFETTTVDLDDVESFLRVAGSSLQPLRASLAAEDARYGPSSFGALAFERTPLLRGPGNRVQLVSLPSLDRRATDGILHILAEGAEREGLGREHFTSAFGKAFQVWAEATIRRGHIGLPDPPRMICDETYDGPDGEVSTPDVMLIHEGALVLIEVVSGPLRAATVTHGDLTSFDIDLDKLVLKKTRQLTRRLADIDAGHTTSLGLTLEGVRQVWPVIVTATPFPARPEIGRAIRRRVKTAGHLRDRRFQTLAIIPAEDLAAAEATMQDGSSFLNLLREWKASARTGDQTFKNFLIARERGGRRQRADHHVEMYRTATRELMAEVFPSETLDDVLGGDVPG